MKYLLLVMQIVLLSLENVFFKQYSLRTKKTNLFLYSTILSITAMLFFLILSKFHLDFKFELLPYSVVFAIFIALTPVFQIYAVMNGSMAITSLAMSYSLIIPTIHGVVFLNEDIGINAYIGFVLLLTSIFMLNAKKEDNIKISIKWLISVFMVFAGNGLSSVVIKMQQLEFNENYKNEFMIITFLVAAILSFMMAIFKKDNLKQELKECFKWAVCNGTANGGVNLLTLILTGLIPSAILFPSVSAGGIALTFVIAVLIYKERLSKVQLIGYMLGIASVILLNL